MFIRNDVFPNFPSTRFLDFENDLDTEPRAWFHTMEMSMFPGRWLCGC